MPPGGATVWSPFPRDTKYFDPPAREFMFNLVVDDLDGALTQVREGGAETVGGVEEHRVRPLRLVHRPRRQQGRALAAEGLAARRRDRLAPEASPPRARRRIDHPLQRAEHPAEHDAVLEQPQRPARLTRVDQRAVLGSRRVVVVVAGPRWV